MVNFSTSLIIVLSSASLTVILYRRGSERDAMIVAVLGSVLFVVPLVIKVLGELYLDLKQLMDYFK
jgi:TRAP-type mannitol/chloroaromatic compound transport system permease small subunit